MTLKLKSFFDCRNIQGGFLDVCYFYGTKIFYFEKTFDILPKFFTFDNKFIKKSKTVVLNDFNLFYYDGYHLFFIYYFDWFPHVKVVHIEKSENKLSPIVNEISYECSKEHRWIDLKNFKEIDNIEKYIIDGKFNWKWFVMNKLEKIDKIFARTYESIFKRYFK